MNLSKVGSHQQFTVTLQNPNTEAVSITNLAVDSDNSTGPVYATNQVIPTGSSCLSSVSNGELLTIGAGSSCTYVFQGSWGLNASTTTQYSYSLSYGIRGLETNNGGAVSLTCKNGTSTGYCADNQSNNNPISYSVISTPQTTTAINDVTSGYYQYGIGTGDTSMMSINGSTKWNLSTGGGTATAIMTPLIYNSSNNTLTAGSPTTYTNVSASGSFGLSAGVTTGSNIYISGFGSTSSANLFPASGNSFSLDSQVIGLDGIVYSGSNWSNMTIPNNYTYTVSGTTLTQLPSNVVFNNQYGHLIGVDASGNLFGVNNLSFGCYVKNGSNYNAWTNINANGYTVLNMSTLQTSNGIYAAVQNSNVNMYNNSNPSYEYHLIDMNTCSISTTNYWVNGSWVNGLIYSPGVLQGQTSQYAILASSTDSTVYIVPLSQSAIGQ